MTPVRTCVGCREKTGPEEMLRVARPEGRLLIGGHGPGRGAWLHPRCLEAALAKGKLARALRAGLSEEEIATLRRNIPQGGGT